MQRHLVILSSTILLSGCFAGAQNFPELNSPKEWGSVQGQETSVVEVESLQGWWNKFDDPVLNSLVEFSLSDSPDRKIAEAKILEARGIRRTTRSSLFPKLDASATGGRQDNASSKVDDYYDAGFDASYEIDVFGKNRKNSSAANSRLEAVEAEYHDVGITLIADVVRSYINYRAFQKQSAVAKKNLVTQEKTLELIKQQREFGEAPQLDVERATTIVNTTKSSIPEFDRLADNARLQLSVLTGKFPGELLPLLSEVADIPGGAVDPVLMSPANVLAMRPDVRAASANLAANTSLAESVTAELFPTFTISGFFKVTESALIDSTSIWNTALGAAVSILDFGRIEGRIDAARAVEMQAYQSYRSAVLRAVTEVETALTDTAHINKQRVSLQKAYDSAERSFILSEELYREGEISFLDVLDAQRTVNEADSALITAEAAQSESLVRLYKSLGVY